MKTWKLPHFSLQLPPAAEVDRGRLESAHRALKEKFSSGQIGFYDWPSQCSEEELEAMENRAESLANEFDGALCIGIGGSHLGPEAVAKALRTPREEDSFPIRWLNNVDGGAVSAARYFVDSWRVATVVISKSGGTTETLAGFFHLSRKLDPKGFTIITDPETGELRKLATKYNWPSFPVPKNVGGRFSVLSSVGLFPSLLGGIDARELIAGALEMRTFLEEMSAHENPAYLYAHAAEAWDRGGFSIQYLMPYSTQLKLLGDWYVQLFGESLGKKHLGTGKPVGFTPMAAVGTSDQHSLLQLFKEGPPNKVVGFLSVKPSDGAPPVGKPSFEVSKELEFLFKPSFDTVAYLASQATQKSLSNSGVPTYRMDLDKIDPKTLGALFFFFETACAFAGELYGVNAFDQPGVEESKKLLRQTL